MDDEKILALYERHYFHELDGRDKLISRLQLSLAIITAVIGLSAYTFTKAGDAVMTVTHSIVFFWVPFVLSCICIISACCWYIRALWGHTYECMPVAAEVESHREKLVGIYAGYESGKETANAYFRVALKKYYVECSSINALINTRRYMDIHRSITSLVCSLPLLGLAALAGFTAG